MTPQLIGVLLLCYLIGAIPFAVLVGRAVRGVDVQRTGSGNAGALNTFRSVGRGAGILVALLDALKAAFAMLIGQRLGGAQLAALCGAIAVVGHCFSPFLLFATRHELRGGWKMALRRAGGKGLASGVAVLLLIDWRLAAAAVLIFALGRWLVFHDETWPTIIAVAATIPLIWLLTHNRPVTLAVLVVCLIIVIKHLPDVRQSYYVS